MSLPTVLLLKVPLWQYPSKKHQQTFMDKNTAGYRASLALSTISGFFEKYSRGGCTLDVYDMNLVVLESWETLEDLADRALEAARLKIEATDFDAFAVSCQFMFNQSYVNRIVDMAHQKNPNAKIIVGGGYATIFPEKSLALPHIDYCVIGEGEHTFIHILNRIFETPDKDFEKDWAFDGYGEKLADGKLNIVPKKVFLDNLNDLPPPKWNFPGLDKYLAMEGAVLPFMASRGCPMACSFCSTHLSWGKPVRYRPVDNVVDEIISHYEKHSVKNFHCVDDNILFDRKWFHDFADAFAARKPDDLKITVSNFDLRFLDRETVRKIKKMGVTAIPIAAESGSQEIQRSIHKKLKEGVIFEKIAMIEEEGLAAEAFWMIGFPGETLEQVRQTVKMARELRTTSMQMFPMFPFPGTEVYEESKAAGIIDLDENDYESLHYRSANIKSEDWDSDTMKRIAYDANMEFNFLSTPLSDTEKGRKTLKRTCDRLEEELPGHVIAFIVRGYIAGAYDDDLMERERCYTLAIDSLQGEGESFVRYIAWAFPQINDFRDWAMNRDPETISGFMAAAMAAPNDSGVPLYQV